MTYELFLRSGDDLIPVDFVTSDTHIGHKNIAKYTGRPYDNEESTRDMDADMVRIWNEVVGSEDTVLHLGDAALGQIVESVKWYGMMNGTKLLVPGNHDYVSSVCTASRRERYASVYAEYFTVLEEMVMLVARSGSEERDLRACHYPTLEDPREGGKYQSKRPPVGDGIPLVHGHTHYSEVFTVSSPLEFHAGVDAHGLKPVSASVIAEWVFSLPV